MKLMGSPFFGDGREKLQTVCYFQDALMDSFEENKHIVCKSKVSEIWVPTFWMVKKILYGEKYLFLQILALRVQEFHD